MEKWWLLLDTKFELLSHDLQRHLFDSFYRFAYRDIIFLLKDHALAEDIIQEAFFKMTTKRHQIINGASARQWAKSIIRNQMIDTLRKKNRHGKSLENVYKEIMNFPGAIEAAATIEETVEDALRNQVLHETILELKSEYSTLLLMYYMEEKSYKEISAEVGVSEQVIAQRLARARKKLAGKFSEKWGDDYETRK